MKKLAVYLSVFATIVFIACFTETVNAAAPVTCGDLRYSGNPQLMGGSTPGDPVKTTVDFNCNTSTPGGAVMSMILWAVNFLAVGVGIAVVIGIVLAGIQYAASDGDAGQVKEAKAKIMNAIIGLFLFLFLYAGVQFMVPGGVFSGASGGSSSGSGAPAGAE